MTAQRLARPDATEYAPFYAGYVAGVPEGDVLDLLERALEETTRLLGAVPEARGDFAYAPGKWTLKEVVGHVVDAERVFSYRALRFARGDTTPLAAFDENAWAPNSGARARTLADLLGEYRAVRAATLALLHSLPAGADLRRGTASGREISVRALAWIIAGHERHHLRLIRERYLD
ncbi:MAG TPA: DinB family protein [Gemmatimonadales bacterium]|jgi:hypothetical protein